MKFVCLLLLFLFSIYIALTESQNVTLIVRQDGSGDYRTIKEAIMHVPTAIQGRVMILIYPGIYREKLWIDKSKPFITLKGADINNPPTITWNDTHNSTGSTLQSATVAIDADNFVAAYIHFENTATHGRGVEGGQAVALRVSGTKAAFYNCMMSGFQDTLYDHKGLHYFKNCSIQGDVDFIFGFGQLLYEDCVIKSIATVDGASITAQKRSTVTEASGFSFLRCTILGGPGRFFLGRPWDVLSRVVFSYTNMPDLVLPAGWDDWNKPVEKIFYGEYKCSGPGSNRAGRVKWSRQLTDVEAEEFVGLSFIGGDSWVVPP